MQVGRKDGRLLHGINNLGVVPRYGYKKKRSRKDVNDGRAPDTNKTLFQSKKQKQKK